MSGLLPAPLSRLARLPFLPPAPARLAPSRPTLCACCALSPTLLAALAGPDTTVECKGDVPDKLANGDSWDDGLAAAGNATALNVTLTDVSFNEYSLNRALRIILNAGSRAASVSVNLDGCSMKGAKVRAGCWV